MQALRMYVRTCKTREATVLCTPSGHSNCFLQFKEYKSVTYTRVNYTTEVHYIVGKCYLTHLVNNGVSKNEHSQQLYNTAFVQETANNLRARVCVCVCVCVCTPLTLTLVSLYRMGRKLSRRSAMRSGLLWAAELNATRATRLTL